MGDFKPADLFVGVIQLFAVLLPGAVLTAALALVFGDPIQRTFEAPLRDPHVGWVAFLVIAYVLGAFVFPIASSLDQFADSWNEKDREREVAKVKAKPKYASELDYPFERAKTLRGDAFGPGATNANKPMNTFSWAKSVLMLEAPAAFSDVLRYEAESKFFRSLIVVLPVSGLLVAVNRILVDQPWPALAALATGALLVWPAAHRYVARRRKSVEWACKYVVVLQQGPLAPSKTSPRR